MMEEPGLTKSNPGSVQLELSCQYCFVPAHSDHRGGCRLTGIENFREYCLDTFVTGNPFPCSNCFLARRQDLEPWQEITRNDTCIICSKEFVQKIGMHLHENESGTVICGLCSLPVIADQLNHHVLRHLEFRSYLLKICSIECLERRTFVEKKLDRQRFVCPICVCFIREKTFLAHMERHIGPARFPCPQCNNKYRFYDSFISHMTKKHGQLVERKNFSKFKSTDVSDLTLKCDHCWLMFSNKEYLIEHIHGSHFKLDLPCEGSSEQPTRMENEDLSCLKQYFPPYPPLRFDRRNFGGLQNVKKYYRSTFSVNYLFPRQTTTTTRREDLELIPVLNKAISCSICRTKFKQDVSLHIYEKEGVGMICSFCSKTIDQSEVRNHQYNHIIERSFMIGICSETCLESTLSVLPDRYPYRVKCFVCLKSYIDARAWLRHLSDHLPEKEWRFTCSGCGLRFPDDSKLRMHLQSHIKSSPCPLCPKTSASDKELRIHLDSVHRHDRIFCSLCEKLFLKPKDYTNHLSSCRKFDTVREMAEVKTTTCGTCGAEFPEQEVKQAHEKQCKTFVHCAYCEFKCVKLESLRIHIHRLHVPSEYVENLLKHCTLCNKTVVSRFFEQHMESHQRKYICEQCGLIFESSNRLSMHKLKHSKNPFSCDQCPKIFFQKHHLEQHVFYNHTDEFPFQCEKCGNKFRREKNLKEHAASLTACRGRKKIKSNRK